MADFSAPLPQANTGAPTATSADVTGFLSYVKSLFSREIWVTRMKNVASLSKSFFNPLEFSRPASQTEWIARVSANATRFSSIYFCFFLPILLNTMLSSWSLRIGTFALVSLWLYAYGYKKDESVLMIGGVPAPKIVACTVISVLVMLITGMINALFGAIVVFAIIGMPHMSLHMAPSVADAMDAIELQAIAPPSF